MNNNEIMVSVFCISFNQAKYIEQCLDSLVVQKTNFRYEIIVHDDCSTDGTIEIIEDFQKKYPELIKPILQTENQYSKGIRTIMATFMIPKASGKYIAICEGDDYWADEYKLQKQVDFLEKHSDYGLIYGKVRPFYQELSKFGKEIGKKVINVKQLIKKGNVIPTCSVLFRKELYVRYINEIKPAEKGWLMGDYPMNLWFMCNSKIKFFPQVMGVYRILNKSASHSDNLDFLIRFSQSTNDILMFFKEQYKIPITLPDHVMFTKFCYYLAKNDREQILKNADFSKLPNLSFKAKLKLFIFKRDLLYNIYRIIKKR